MQGVCTRLLIPLLCVHASESRFNALTVRRTPPLSLPLPLSLQRCVVVHSCRLHRHLLLRTQNLDSAGTLFLTVNAPRLPAIAQPAAANTCQERATAAAAAEEGVVMRAMRLGDFSTCRLLLRSGEANDDGVQVRAGLLSHSVVWNS